MRVGEIVKDWEGRYGAYISESSLELPHGTHDQTLIFGTYGESWIDTDEVSVVTVGELFEYAGLPVPEDAKLVYHMNNVGGNDSPVFEPYWSFYYPDNSGQIIPMRGSVSPRFPADTPIPAVDMARVPALDAIDVLPPFVKALIPQPPNSPDAENEQ